MFFLLWRGIWNALGPLQFQTFNYQCSFCVFLDANAQICSIYRFYVLQFSCLPAPCQVLVVKGVNQWRPAGSYLLQPRKLEKHYCRTKILIRFSLDPILSYLSASGCIAIRARPLEHTVEKLSCHLPAIGRLEKDQSDVLKTEMRDLLLLLCQCFSDYAHCSHSKFLTK